MKAAYQHALMPEDQWDVLFRHAPDVLPRCSLLIVRHTIQIAPKLTNRESQVANENR
jgi:hypothetical protein